MIDRKKVIKGLLCIKGDFIPCASCKYATAEGYGRGDRCKRQCASDAVALLKEQKNEYENGFNDAMQGKQELMYEGEDGKWYKKDW